MPQKIIIATLALGTLLTGTIALAQTTGAPLPVTFPIAALGGCTSKDACRAYCDDPANRDACFAYAQTHGLMTTDAVAKARAYLAQISSSTPRMPPPPPPGISSSTPPGGGEASSSIDAILAAGGGPGGCTSKDACKTYCDDPANVTACLQFAQQYHLMPPQAIDMAKKLEAQVGPGGCVGVACKTFCQDASHAQVCLVFAQQNGFISKDDAAGFAARLKLSSSTPPLPMNPGDASRVGSTTPPPRNPFKPSVDAGNAPPFGGANGMGTRPAIFKEPQRPPQPPPPPQPQPNDASSSGQSGSIFFSVLHFFGL